MINKYIVIIAYSFNRTRNDVETFCSSLESTKNGICIVKENSEVSVETDAVFFLFSYIYTLTVQYDSTYIILIHTYVGKRR